MKTSSRILKNSTYLYIKMIITIITSLYTSRVFLNTLGASDYGLFSLLGGVIYLFGFLQDTLTRSSLRYMCYYKANGEIVNQQKVYTISVILHLSLSFLILSLLLLITPYLFSGFLNIESDRIEAARWVYYSMVLAFVFTVMSIPYDSVLNANENMLYYSKVGVLENILKLLLAISLPFVATDKLIYFAFASMLITIISLVLKRVYCFTKYEECRFRLSLFDKRIAKNMTSYAGWNFLTSVSSLASFNAIPIFLNIYFGTVINAAQGIASQVNGFLTQFSTNLLKALSPTITKSGSDNVVKMIKFGTTGSKLSFIILAFFAVPIIVECPYILKIWLKNVPEWTSIFCVLLLIRSVINQLLTVFADCIYANADIKNYCIIKSFFNFLPIPLMFLAFKMGVAPYMVYVIMFLCWEFFGGIIIFFFMKKLYKFDIIPYLLTILLPCSIVFLFELFVGYSISCYFSPSFLRLLFNSIIITVLLILSSWMIILNSEEKMIVRELLRKIECKVYESRR